LVGLCGVAGLTGAHEYLHEYVEASEVPLHKQEFVQDSTAELERKWGFEVCTCIQIPSLVFWQDEEDELMSILSWKVGILRRQFVCASGPCQVSHKPRNDLRCRHPGSTIRYSGQL
jgi:hypothetical protein